MASGLTALGVVRDVGLKRTAAVEVCRNHVHLVADRDTALHAFECVDPLACSRAAAVGTDAAE